MLIKFLQSLPEFKGKKRVSRWILGNYVKNKRDIVLKGADELQYKIPNFIEPVGFDLLINGVHEKETSDYIVKKIPLNGVFIDIGANIGAIALPVCKRRKDIKTICIEASPRVFSYLKFNAHLNNLKNCVLINKAMDEVDGQNVAFFSPPELFGKGSMSAVFTDKAEQIETVTLDAILTLNNISKVNFIKIDIEGYEYYAFKGAEKTLRKPDAPDILFEFIDWAEKQARHLKPGDAQELLMTYGYSLYPFKDGKPERTPLTRPITAEGWHMLYATKQKL